MGWALGWAFLGLALAFSVQATLDWWNSPAPEPPAASHRTRLWWEIIGQTRRIMGDTPFDRVDLETATIHPPEHCPYPNLGWRPYMGWNRDGSYWVYAACAEPNLDQGENLWFIEVVEKQK